MRRIIGLITAAVAVLTGQVPRSAADPVNTRTGQWGQLPPGCIDHDATDVAGSIHYQTCHTESGFTFDILPPVAAVAGDQFCNSTACLQVVRLLYSIKALPCIAATSLKALKLETFDGREACFGPAGNNVSIQEIQRPAPSGSASSDTTVSGTGTPSATVSTVVVVTKAPEYDAGPVTSTTMIVIISSFGTIFIALVAALVFVKFRQKKKRLTVTKAQSTTSEEYDIRRSTVPIIQEAFSPQSSNYDGGTLLSTTWKSGPSGFTSTVTGWDEELLATVRIPYEKLEFGALVSRGGYGEVYRGTYRGKLVAIKTLLPDRRRDMRQIESFVAEIKIMAAMEHDRIVRFLGVAWDSLEELSVVTEFLSGGDLRSVLSGFESDQSRPRGFDAAKVKIALHVAHGLTYMHTLQPIVLHRDLKSRNILLDEELNAKITDFGVSRERADRTMTAGVGSSLWMAPEVMMGERYDEKADVFSFGVVLSELDGHALPYSHATESGTTRRLPDTVILQMVSLGKLRVAFTDEQQSEIAQIGFRCVAVNPDDRPTAAEVLHLIHQVSRCYLP